MTSIKDLELRIKSAASTLEMLRGELEELRQQEQQEPEQESLLGRWATHPTYGRGIITDVEPSADGDVEFAFPDAGDCETRTSSIQVTLDEIDLDPVTLNNAKDFEDAPEGTIAETLKEPRYVYTKARGVWYATGSKYYIPSHEVRECRVIRWGNGQ